MIIFAKKHLSRGLFCYLILSFLKPDSLIDINLVVFIISFFQSSNFPNFGSWLLMECRLDGSGSSWNAFLPCWGVVCRAQWVETELKLAYLENLMEIFVYQRLNFNLWSQILSAGLFWVFSWLQRLEWAVQTVPVKLSSWSHWKLQWQQQQGKDGRKRGRCCGIPLGLRGQGWGLG